MTSSTGRWSPSRYVRCNIATWQHSTMRCCLCRLSCRCLQMFPLSPRTLVQRRFLACSHLPARLLRPSTFVSSHAYRHRVYVGCVETHASTSGREGSEQSPMPDVAVGFWRRYTKNETNRKGGHSSTCRFTSLPHVRQSIDKTPGGGDGVSSVDHHGGGGRAFGRESPPPMLLGISPRERAFSHPQGPSLHALGES